MKTVFAGTPDFAARVLANLASSPFKPSAVLTQPDRPKGRGKKLIPSAVKLVATEYDIPVYQPSSLKPAPAQQILTELAPDVLIVVAYGLILPKEVLDIPKYGCINVHASLLPRWRGAAPIERAYMAGDDSSGVCIMKMDEGLDTGPVYATRTVSISATMSVIELEAQICEHGSQALIEVLNDMEGDRALRPMPQSEDGATYAKKLTNADRIVDWSAPAQTIVRQISALAERMPVRAKIKDKGLQLIAASEVKSTSDEYQPGEIIIATKQGIDVQCATNVLRIHKLKFEGKSVIDAASALNGRADLFMPGTRLS